MSSGELVVKHTSRVIYVEFDDGSKAFLRYSVEGNVMNLVETYTPPQHRGKGVAKAMVEYAVKLARENNWLIKPICSYAVYYFMKNPDKRNVLIPEYRNLSDEEFNKLYNERLRAEQNKEK